MQPRIVLGVKTHLAARKVVHCIEKVCKGGGMLWYGYTRILSDMKVSSTLSLRSQDYWWHMTNLCIQLLFLSIFDNKSMSEFRKVS